MTHACQRFGKAHKALRLPRFSQVPDSLHLPRKLTLQTAKSDDFPALAMQNGLHVRKRTRTHGNAMPSKLRIPRRQLCASLRSQNEHRNLTKELLSRELAQTKPREQSEHLNEHQVFTLTVRTLLCGHTVWVIFGQGFLYSTRKQSEIQTEALTKS